MTPAEIRAARAAQPRARARDFAESHGIPEAALVAAFTGPEVVAIAADPRRSCRSPGSWARRWRSPATARPCRSAKGSTGPCPRRWGG